MSGYRPAPSVAVVEDDDVIYTAVLPDGPIVVLDGVAAAIWVEAREGSTESLVDRVAAMTDASAADIRDDVEAFVADLVRRGLLVPAEP